MKENRWLNGRFCPISVLIRLMRLIQAKGQKNENERLNYFCLDLKVKGSKEVPLILFPFIIS